MAKSTRRVGRRDGGFTLLEVIVAVLIISILIGLLISGMLYARRYAASAVDAQAVDSVVIGLGDYRREFGAAPPLVRERSPVQAGEVVSSGGVNRVAVYLLSSGTDEALLRREGQPPPPPTNPFDDYRFSERTIPYYLVGALNQPLSGPTGDLPIDGVKGPGFYRPADDGAFEIPRDVLAAAQNPNPERVRTGKKYDSLIDFSKPSPTLFTDPSAVRSVEVRDRLGLPIRYYTWLPGRLVNGRYIVEALTDLNVPLLVGRVATDNARNPAFIPTGDDRDLEKNTTLRNAKWAVVAAGPDGAFGDEPLALLAQRLNVVIAPADELRYRFQAEKDNIVRVGD